VQSSSCDTLTTKQPPVLFLLGATASGKTAASLAVAYRYGVEVINADSRQVYRGMDIGTAKPTKQDMGGVPHHLIDVADPDDPYNLALFLGQARQAIAGIQARGRLPLIVGGTGQYVWGMVEGWQVPPVPPQQEVRARLEREACLNGSAVLHRRLQRVDAAAAKVIDERNVRRLVRALEVWEVTGQRFSAQRRREQPSFSAHVFGLWVPREDLYRRIDSRMEAMVAAGWLDEVIRLLDAGYTPDLPSFSSAGYRELSAYARGELGWEEALRRTTTSVRRLARRQGAWFRRDDPRIIWAGGAEELIAHIGRLAEGPMIQFGP
jgi:tRNA dimethylallyltransferase